MNIVSLGCLMSTAPFFCAIHTASQIFALQLVEHPCFGQVFGLDICKAASYLCVEVPLPSSWRPSIRDTRVAIVCTSRGFLQGPENSGLLCEAESYVNIVSLKIEIKNSYACRSQIKETKSPSSLHRSPGNQQLSLRLRPPQVKSPESPHCENILRHLTRTPCETQHA
jgi:hypothetical protein